MFKHLFKLIWNKRRQNFLFLSEILVSFLVIFAVFSFLTYYYQNYSKPLGFDYKRVWCITYNNGELTKNNDSLKIFYDNLQKALKSMPQIEEVAYSGANYPYSDSFSSTGLTQNGKKFNYIANYTVGIDYKKVWNVPLLEGRWFLPEDVVSNNKNIVINETLKKQLFGNAQATGKLIGNYDEKEKLKVIGVMQDIKASGDFLPAGSAIFNPIDTAFHKYTHNILIKVREGADATFESQLYKFMANTVKNAVEIKHLDEMRNSKNKQTIIPMVIFIIIASFLIINVALGLFGVLWYNINKRKGEIGLRRAIGASGRSVSYQLVMEAIILATISLLVGCFFAGQFPLLSVFNIPASVYIIAMLLSVAFIYLLVLFCSLYPGKQAANIHPAVALHEE
ncbi:ABC transporter permease [Pedobacter alluvionis]|uniref:FtsX-like permease family protein n=1 Tax=Pedobacter alluvionis TaxID=475253 RepID=A0A497XLJ0_9SPHI|nr:ABC transporter permease [Pedobacter alluvionis]RLJ69503.1 putative ABC transport system permease protein [Pedobacter alluvionis]TFB28424.1 FtsX-like permease family protein [Pedobacter alluvionis]